MHYGYMEEMKRNIVLKQGEIKVFFKKIWANCVNPYSTYSTFNIKTSIIKNMKDRKGRRYTFMGTHDGQKEKSRTN